MIPAERRVGVCLYFVIIWRTNANPSPPPVIVHRRCSLTPRTPGGAIDDQKQQLDRRAYPLSQVRLPARLLNGWCGQPRLPETPLRRQVVFRPKSRDPRQEVLPQLLKHWRYRRDADQDSTPLPCEAPCPDTGRATLTIARQRPLSVHHLEAGAAILGQCVLARAYRAAGLEWRWLICSLASLTLLTEGQATAVQSFGYL